MNEEMIETDNGNDRLMNGGLQVTLEEGASIVQCQLEIYESKLHPEKLSWSPARSVNLPIQMLSDGS